MRVVFVGPFGLSPKHTMLYRALPLAKALVARGHDVTILLPPWQNPEDAGRRLDDEGVRVLNLGLPARIPLFFELALTMDLVREVLRRKPAVVHCFKPKAYAGLVLWSLWLLRWVRAWGGRLVVDTDDWEGAGGWNEREAYAPWLRAFFASQERWCLTHADAVTVASRTLEALAWSLGTPPARVTYVPNGATCAYSLKEQLTGQTPGQNLGSTVLLYTRFVECSVARIAQILCLLLARHSETRVVVVGKGMSQQESRLAELMDKCGARDRITWLGWLSPSELRTVFAQTDVALFPMDDNLINRAKCSVKLTDLLSSGIPVVADAVGQAREYIQDGSSGSLVATGDSVAFVAAVLRLLDNPELRRRMSAAARERMESEFEWKKLAVNVERTYAS